MVRIMGVMAAPPLEVDPQEVKRRLDSGEKLHLIDVREPHEFAQAKIEGATLIPMRSVPGELQDLEARADEGTLIVYCHHGVRSLNVVNWLREQGVERLPEHGRRHRRLEPARRSFGATLLRMRSDWRERAPLYLAGAAAAAYVGYPSPPARSCWDCAIVALLIARDKWRWPPVVWPVALWMAWTLVSLAASGHARGGLPQVKKFYVWLMLFVVYTALRTLPQIRVLVMLRGRPGRRSPRCGDSGSSSTCTAPLRRFFYYVYVNGTRITGFVDHWMTFSALLMMTLLMRARCCCTPQDRASVSLADSPPG